jgi:hypothetical protein
MNLSKFYIFLILLFVITLAAELFVEIHSSFNIVKIKFFYAWFGFSTCIVLVVVAKLLGFMLKRDENYYDNK